MKRKILSIDGGGIKGIYAAQVLADIEEECNVRICDHFDIITGTSTGAVIAVGLAMGIAAKDILKLYLDEGKSIFSGYKANKAIGMICSSKYKNKNLKSCLERVFGEKKIGDCTTRILIPSYNLNTGKVEVFKTSHNPRFSRDYKEKIVDVLLSTTAAPTYFPAHNFKRRGRYIDGGVGANNPTYIAVVEALTSCGWKAEDLYVLSIGCTDDYKKFDEKKKVSGLHVLDIIKFFMRAEAQYSENISKLLLNNDSKRYLRINRQIDPKECSLDNVSSRAMDKLVEYGRDSSKKHIYSVREMFLCEKKEEFIPVNTLQ